MVRRGQGTTHGAGRLSGFATPTLSYVGRLPGNPGCPLLYGTIRQRASLTGPDRGSYQRRTGLPFPTGCDGAADVAETTFTPRKEPDQAGRRAGAAHCPAGEAERPVPSSPSSPPIQLSRLHHRPAMGRRWNWRPIIAATPRSRTPYATSLATASGRNPHAVGALRRQRRLAGGRQVTLPAHNLARPWTLRGLVCRRADRDHQEGQAAGLRSGGTDRNPYDIGAPPHFASNPGAGLGKPAVQSGFGAGCKPFRSRPDGQAATDPTSPQSRATPVARVPCCVSSRHPAHRNSRIGP